ncbi:hypothetical protein FRC00_008612 [Tulasnella sp. 408]|nr:hypothetical protein FRC00_008612 [Tulasnella sp. 408]
MTLGFVILILGVLLWFQSEKAQGGRGILVAIRAGYFYAEEGNSPSPDPEGYVQPKTRLWVLTISSFASPHIGDKRGLDDSRGVPGRWGMAPALPEWLERRVRRNSKSCTAYSSGFWGLLPSLRLWKLCTSFSRRWPLLLPASTEPHMYGVSFNQSICPDMLSKYNTSLAISPQDFECLGSFEHFVAYESWGNDIGFNVMTNSSEARFQIGIVEEDTAVVLPAPKYIDWNSTYFTISTFATRAKCTSITHLCKEEDGVPANCTSAGYPQLPYFRESGGISTGQRCNFRWGSFDNASFSSNPTKMVVQLQWEPLEQGAAASAKMAKPDLAITYEPQPTLYAECDLTFFHAAVLWHSMNQQWYLKESLVASSKLASVLWLPTIWQYTTEQLAANLMHTARRDARDDVMAALSHNLAKLSLATAAGFYVPAEAESFGKTEEILVSAYPVLPIMVLLMLLCTYALIALALFVSSCWLPDESIIVPTGGATSRDDRVESSTLTLAQRWLTNPLPLVGLAFPRGDGLDGTRSASYFAKNAAYDGDEAHTRLAVGVDGERFGVMPWGRKRHSSLHEEP